MLRRTLLTGLAGVAAPTIGCGGRARARREDDEIVVFKRQPLWGDPGPFRALLDRFVVYLRPDRAQPHRFEESSGGRI